MNSYKDASSPSAALFLMAIFSNQATLVYNGNTVESNIAYGEILDVLAATKTAVENSQNLIIEGCYIPFDWDKDFAEDYLQNIKYYCLVMSEEYIKNHFDDIKKYANIIENRLDDSGFTIENAIKENTQILELAKKHKANYILIDDKYEIDINDGGLFLNIVIGDYYIPNEQKTDYFVVTIYNINLPWVLNEPFPTSVPYKNSFFNKIHKKCSYKQ